MYNQTHIEINLKALEQNINAIKNFAGNKIIQGVVKANAYGHGDYEITRALEKVGVNNLGVARVEEGVRLREKSITSQILVLGGCEEHEFEALINNHLTPVIYSQAMAEKLNNYLKFRGIRLPVHIKMDTGMHRLGIPFEEHQKFFAKLQTLENLVLDGLMSHMVSAGAKTSEWNDLQTSRFKELIKNWEIILSKKPAFIHLENSAGFFNFNMDFTNVSRLGIAIYGYGHEGLKPVLRLYSMVKDIKTIKAGETVSYGGWYRAEKDSTIALVPVGYGDGFMRGHRKGSVLINGNRVSIIGVICMDYFIVDITDAVDVKVGDRVTIIGEENSASDWAKVSGTIVYEVLTLLNPRIRRLYSNGND
jgi:alanine racemase